MNKIKERTKLVNHMVHEHIAQHKETKALDHSKDFIDAYLSHMGKANQSNQASQSTFNGKFLKMNESILKKPQWILLINETWEDFLYRSFFNSYCTNLSLASFLRP